MTKKEWIKKMGEHNTDKYEVVAFGVTQKPIVAADGKKVGQVIVDSLARDGEGKFKENWIEATKGIHLTGQKGFDIVDMSKVEVNPRGHLSHITEYMEGKGPTVIVSVKEYKELLEIAGKYYTLLGNE
jgi:hypothetical protein